MPQCTARVGLSSFWTSGRNGRLLDLFAAGADLGLDCFELSGINDSTFYDKVRPGQFPFVSLHHPAPPAPGDRRLGCSELRQLDLVFTSLDDERRRHAVGLAQRSIEIAAEYGAQVVVLHVGMTSADPSAMRRLDELYLQGRIDCAEADQIRSLLAQGRTALHAEHLEAVRRSLDTLIPLAERYGIRLGLENRPLPEMPNWSEMNEILSSYPNTTIGYWHDTGHAEHMSVLKVTPHVEWLKAFRTRTIGLHLHDLTGVEPHQEPGIGTIDWASLARYLPDECLKIIEVDHTVSLDGLRRGIQHLSRAGWIPAKEERMS